ncbi:MAG: acyl-CoA dehydrogenase [Betaproteobacteria bacterium]|jgi:acyl-CoA dehydrogenase|nr:acyl-CoA dehydrogenase [Betaproteobacteria bacterium]HAB46982.1 acyl-CoA dehydrogenase [Lautropia sp.]NBO96397.1 acyl-CoA dehydrogenase [Betaproteobacteria bacterium]NBP34039.1 acyl-CoA dehydrogenase [Betaproteobacteria bacterium]NBP36868.1 acyl-CoA dehydrogenase [Betaproteobacteria bacterium]
MFLPRQSLALLDPLQWPDHTDEQRAIYKSTIRFVEHSIKPNLQRWEQEGMLPRSLHREAGTLGLTGLGFPEAFGGTPADNWSRALVTWGLSQAGAGGVIAGLMSHSIMVWPLAVAGSKRIQSRELPQLLRGEMIGSLCVTEASGGSDVSAIQTQAVACDQGWKLNGSKLYITSGMRADLLLVAARTGAKGSQGISLFAVPGDAKGLSRQPLDKTGWLCSDTAALFFDDVYLPHDALVGEINRGFQLVMQNFNAERLFMAVQALAMAGVCLEESLAWAWSRQSFGQPLIQHQVIRHKFSAMLQAMLPCLHWARRLCQDMDGGRANAGEIALLKNAATRCMRDIADESIQILGGQGFMRSSASERIYREVKVMMIGGGADEIMHELACRQLGVMP